MLQLSKVRVSRTIPLLRNSTRLILDFMDILGRLWLRRCFYWLTKRGRASPFTLSTYGQCWKVRFGTSRQHCRAESLAGKKLLTALSSAGIPCTYLLLSAIGSIIAEVSTVSNGAVHSRAGTALVSVVAKQHPIPVVVCCETYKISEMVQLDSFTKNELGTPIPRSR